MANGHGYQEIVQSTLLEFMEHKEYLLFQTILDLDNFTLFGLIQVDLFGFLEDLDMIQQAQVVMSL